MNKGLDVAELPAAAQANYETPINRWDAINCLTNLASNPIQSSVAADHRELDKVEAGKMLNAKADCLNWNRLTPKLDWGRFASATIDENKFKSN